jgi:RNA polymerase sigma factor for flagellar operon FliA
VGLTEAAQRYRPGKAKFSTYAYIRIRGAILNYLRLREPIFPNMKKKEDALGRSIVVPLTPADDENEQKMEIPCEDHGYEFADTLAVIKSFLTKKEFQIVMLKYQGFTQVEISKLM